jgi:hypothetical protein
VAKWKLTDASARRIMAAYLRDDSGGDRYHRLRKALKAEGQQGFDAMGQMLQWIGEHYPKHIPGLAASCSYLYEGLLHKTKTFLNGFDSLSNECRYAHYHEHSKDD